MPAIDPHPLLWRKSSYSGTGGGQCVEVADALPAIRVRDSKVPAGAVLSFPSEAWAAFLSAATRERL
ncbi:hypothetical protein HNR23_003245 [Nocardiopsis mwathae]|uniref:DUF397 domain-containing protein n=1 Tax=Nocardiopsis mwathae TaxID=1472723 RepID=A0A7W9YJA4_9ACTN|nr:DUF397 domain-containing protein [Nocardiopsis mwathae]MBB6173185.1 hypothetical protein [Nocardiopsis mwathae]